MGRPQRPTEALDAGLEAFGTQNQHIRSKEGLTKQVML